MKQLLLHNKTPLNFKMKFYTNSVKSCAARIGILNEFQRIPDASFETPLVLIYTKRGSVPHLTKDVFQMVTKKQHLLSVSVPSTFTMVDTIKDLNIGFANFVSMKEHLNFLSVQDPGQATPPGFKQPDSISIWCRTGRHPLTAKKYMNIVEAFKPDFYVVLCDGDTDTGSGPKCVSKAVKRSKLFMEVCLDRHLASETLKSTGVLGAIEGGYDLEARTCSINDLKDKPFIGYVIDGLHRGGPEVRNISTDQIKNVVEHTINQLPTEKLKVSMGCWNPITVLDLVELGVDIFDTTYPYICTENSQALTFMCNQGDCNNMLHLMSLSEKRYADDCTPICQHCPCVTCQNHTKAYIHHLHHTKEMLGSVLLMIHNVHQYLEFFSAIRENIKKGTLNEFRKKISPKFKQMDLLTIT